MNNINNGNVTIMLCNTVEEALKIWVPNGCTTFFVVFNAGMMILRSTDLRGFPSQPRFFKMTEEFQYTQQMPQTNDMSKQSIDMNQFATKAEFDELKALIISSMNTPQQIQQRSNKGKGGNNS